MHCESKYLIFFKSVYGDAEIILKSERITWKGGKRKGKEEKVRKLLRDIARSAGVSFGFPGFL
jgi:hypothetical protein